MAPATSTCTLGLLLTVDSPYFVEEEYIPEATILRALTFFHLCEYDDAERVLLQFEGEYQPMRDELKAFLGEYELRGGQEAR